MNLPLKQQDTLDKLYKTLQNELERKPLCPDNIKAIAEAIKAVKSV